MSAAHHCLSPGRRATPPSQLSRLFAARWPRRYLLGGATPSSSQTQQYLLRNEALKQADEIVALAVTLP